MIVKVQEGLLLPRFYGVAWLDYMRHEAVCLPIPFNVIAGYLHSAWCWMMGGYRFKRMDVMDAYWQGYEDATKKE